MYTALYRKYRPQSFEDLCGQDQIAVTLKNELLSNKLSHAYLFCGTRGTGKTSTAKLLAKAVNCKSPVGYNPCNHCESCVSINEGNSIDVYEIDAASNRGIDDIRNLREAIKFTPTLGRYKVYIIDEVHMLTNEAFNALLKTLEEPPDYVLFILATTEPHKLPATILSRCQRFDFRRISVETIVTRLQMVCNKEKLKAEEDALKLIARNSDGAMRDALSILDQCAVFGNREISYDTVLKVLGIVNDEFLFRVSEAVLSEDASSAIMIIDEIASGGKDINQFIRDLLVHYRNLLMTKVVEKSEDVIDMSREGIDRLKKLSAQYDKNNIIRCIDILAQLESEAKWSGNPRILLEVAIIRMCKLSGDMSLEGVLARLSKLEEMAAKGKFAAAAPEVVPERGAAADATEEKKDKPTAVKSKANTASVQSSAEILSKWQGFIQEIKSRGKIKLRTYLAMAKPLRLEGGTLVLGFEKEDQFSKEALETPANRSEVETAASQYFGIPIRIKCFIIGETAEDEDQDDIVKAAVQLVGKDRVEVIDE